MEARAYRRCTGLHRRETSTFADGMHRHAGSSAFKWTLHHRDATLAFDFRKPDRAIIEHAGEDHTYHARTIGRRGRTEQRIDRRTGEVLLRPVQPARGLTLVACGNWAVRSIGGPA
jgi:hypothetical protein